MGIVVSAVAALWGFNYWQNYKEEREIKTLIKEIRQNPSATTSNYR